MLKRKIKLPTIDGVVVGEVATQDLPLGPRYHEILFEVSDAAGDTFDDIIDEIRVMQNGVAQRTMLASELNGLNSLNGERFEVVDAGTAASGNPGYKSHLRIFFAEQFRKQPEVTDLLAWRSGGLDSFQIEFEVKEAAATPVIRSVAIIDDMIVRAGTNGPIGPAPADGQTIVKWIRQQVGVESTLVELNKLRRSADYLSLHFFDDAIENIEVLRNGVQVVAKDITKQRNDTFLIGHEMFPVAGRFDVVFDSDDLVDSALRIARDDDFQIKLELSDGTPRNIPLIYQLIGQRD